MFRRRLRVDITWCDENGVVHIMVDDLYSEYDPPFVLRSYCAHGSHTHECSDAMRSADAREAPTCFACLTAPGSFWKSADTADCECWNSLLRRP